MSGVVAGIKNHGVYIAPSFVLGQAPVYTQYITGLPSVSFAVMAIDPFDPFDRMFVLASDGSIYRLDRNVSNTWATCLTLAQAQAILGQSASDGQVATEHLTFVAIDPANNGHVYAILTYYNWEAGWPDRPGGKILRSTDGGDNWAFWLNGPVVNRQIAYMDVYDGEIALGCCTSIAFGSGKVSAVDESRPLGEMMNQGALSPSLGLSQWWPTVKAPSERGLNYWYFYTHNAAGDLLKATNYPLPNDDVIDVETKISGAWGLYTGNLSGLWIDPLDNDHQLLISGSSGYIHKTANDWTASTSANIGATSASNLVVSQGVVAYMRKRQVWALEDEDSTTPINMSGNLPPSTGLAAYNGLYIEAEPPRGGAYFHAVEMGDNWTDAGMGIALAGDRGARKAWEYPILHTNDIDRADQGIHHTLGDDSTQAAPGDHTHTGLATPVTIEAGEDLDAGDLVDIYDDTGALVRKADSSLGYPADGYVLADVIAGNDATVYVSGLVTGLSGLTPGAKIYLSTAGGVTETSPTTANYIVQEVGVAVSATSIKFEPQLTILIS